MYYALVFKHINEFRDKINFINILSKLIYTTFYKFILFLIISYIILLMIFMKLLNVNIVEIKQYGPAA